MVSLADRLRQNYVGFDRLELSDLPAENVNDLVDAIKNNGTIEAVSIRGRFAETITIEDTQALIAAIGSLPKLTELSAFLLPPNCLLHLKTFITLISEAGQLRKLNLCGITLVGNHCDLEDLAGVLQNHESLREFNLWRTVFQDLRISIDPLLTSLANIPTLQKVVVDMKHTRSLSHGRSLGLLCSSPWIKCLTLGGLALSDENLNIMNHALETNERLTELALCDCSMTAQGRLSLARLLEANSNLERLELCGMQMVDDDSCVAIASALTTENSTLKRLDLIDNDCITRRGYEALLHMIEKNYSLERMETDTNDEDLEKKIEFYLKLNRSGRGSLFRETRNRTKWVDAVASHARDFDIFLYLLSSNPSIFITKHSDLVTNNDTAAGDNKKKMKHACRGKYNGAAAAAAADAAANNNRISGKKRSWSSIDTHIGLLTDLVL